MRHRFWQQDHPTSNAVYSLLTALMSMSMCICYLMRCNNILRAPNSGPFPNTLKFGDVYAELPCLGWVTATAWNPTGDKLAYTGQDSSVTVASFVNGAPVLQSLRHKSLPFTSLGM